MAQTGMLLMLMPLLMIWLMLLTNTCQRLLHPLHLLLRANQQQLKQQQARTQQQQLTRAVALRNQQVHCIRCRLVAIQKPQ
jgi:hypothetical protein